MSRSAGFSVPMEVRKRISASMKGRPSNTKGKKLSPETCARMSASRIGWRLSEETKRKISQSERGKAVSEETRQKISASGKGRPAWNKGGTFPETSGKNHHNWNGGVTAEHRAFRVSWPYVKWKKAVLKRDEYRCVLCGAGKGNVLVADHIKRFADFPELRLDISNGRTLCEPCHRVTPTYGNKKQDHDQLRANGFLS